MNYKRKTNNKNEDRNIITKLALKEAMEIEVPVTEAIERERERERSEFVEREREREKWGFGRDGEHEGCVLRVCV